MKAFVEKAMKIVITKISSEQHRVSVTRHDGTTSSINLNSRSFLRHDFAHFALEKEIPIKMGYWGHVASGAPLSGENLKGRDIAIAEKLAGPVQTLIRREADSGQYLAILEKIQPELASVELAERVWSRVRALLGHWKATAYGDNMVLIWEDLPIK